MSGTHRKHVQGHSDTMCAYCVGSNASFPCPSSHRSARIAVHRDDTKGNTIPSSLQLSPFQAIPPSTATTPRFLSDPDILITSTRHTHGGPVNPTNMVQPRDDVIDHWFDRLGLSLDTPLGTLSDVPNLSPSVSVLDDISLSTSLRILNPTPVVLPDTLISTSEPHGPSEHLPSPSDRPHDTRRQLHGVVRHQPRGTHTQQRPKVYDRPGRKPAAEYEPDPVKLQASCELRGGTDFACQWINTVFKDGVTKGGLVRRLKLTEIKCMHFTGGFTPSLAYDGFLQGADDGFECCLCTVDNRIWWKNKKDAIRHLRKFHFGLADRCNNCYKRIYSTGEMKSHRCVSLQGPPALTATVKPKDNANGPVDDTLKSERTTRPKDVLFESWPTSLTVISSPSN